MRRCWTAIRHSPRCVARSRVIVELFGSTLPADVLHDESSLPRAVDELAPARTSISAEPHQQGQVGENVGQAQALALAVKRSMAISSPAVGERAASAHTATTAGHPPALSPRRAGRAPAPSAWPLHEGSP
jgi:hypothetical protein